MARMLDLLQGQDSRRQRADARPAPPPAEETPEEDSGVPFIEVGAPLPGAARRPARVVTPTIIPMPRPAPAVIPATDSSRYFRIAFQPLPFPDRPEGPLEQRLAAELVAFHQPDHEVSQQYRRVLGEIEAQMGGLSGPALLFAAPAAGTGTTTVLLNLAVTRAVDRRVVVVDANLHRPAVAERLGLAEAPGLREVLARTVPLAWAVRETGRPNLAALTAGHAEVECAMDLWPVVLDQLRQRFDWVLIDGGECRGADWAVLNGTATAAYFVLSQACLERVAMDETMTRAANARGYVLTSN